MGKMKKLDETKTYYLGDLSEDQLKELCIKIGKIDSKWDSEIPFSVFYKLHKKKYLYSSIGMWFMRSDLKPGVNIINAKTLFEDEVEETLSIIQEAEQIINGSRAEDYGDVEENFTRIADGWKVIFGVENISPRQVAHAMIWLKTCRDLNTPKRDNLVDIAGYAGCIDKMDRKEKV